jgi:spore coat polysaccharide biosynthesis protein SpsF
VDPVIIDEVVEFYHSTVSNSKYDYIRTTDYPIGLNVELFSRAALEICFLEAKSSYDREHVTPYFYKNPLKFKIHTLHKEFDHSRYRLTMDTMEDYEKINKIFNYYSIQGNYCFGWKDIKRLIDCNSELI